MNELPDDIIFNIKDFLFEMCLECNNKCYIDNLRKNITTTYYKDIFNDDFPFPRIHKTYKFICNRCISNLKKQLIIPI